MLAARPADDESGNPSGNPPYIQLIDAYIKPTFGDRPVAELDVELLERFYARLQHCNKLCSGTRRRGHTCKPLSGSTIRQIHFIIRASLDRAVRWKYLGINEAALAEPPAFGSPAPDLYRDIIYVVTGLTCPVCGLTLASTAEIRAAGLSQQVTRTERENLQELYLDTLEPEYGND